MNKLVAWIPRESLIGLDERRISWARVYLNPNDPLEGNDEIPLYTHPVKDKPHPKCDEACMYLCQMRELTDEEIIAEAEKHDWLGLTSESEWHPEIEFAKAILRKAQEK